MESRFTARFNTNYVPSDEEIRCIQTDLLSHSEDLAHIDKLLRELSAERDRIQSYIDSHRALISHPRRLPPDIVREIFIACLPTNNNAVMSVREAPLLLCGICSAWRTIALSTSRLWTSLHLPIDFILKRKQRISAVARWLQLSGACPVSLSVLGEERLWPAQQLHATEIPAFVELLVKSSDRWSNVEFAHLSQAVACGLKEIHTPMLESIKITAEVSVLHQLDIFRAPSLRALALHTQGPGRLDEFVLDLPLFWDRLTHINLDSTGPESPSQGLCLYNVFVLLRRCPQLISFAFRANTSRDHFDSISGHVSLPFLKTFVLFEPAILEPSSIHRLMQHLSMPELRQLHVPTVSNHTEPCPNFLATIGVSSPLIEVLLINLPSFTEHSILDALTGLPSLTKLTVLNIAGWTWGQAVEADFSHPEHLLALLTPGSVVVCSQLQDLRVRDCISLVKNVLVEFIQKRIDLTPGFRRFDIVFTRPCGTDMLEDEIQSYASRGLHLSLSVSDDDSWGFTPSEFTPWTGLSTFNWSESF